MLIGGMSQSVSTIAAGILYLLMRHLYTVGYRSSVKARRAWTRFMIGALFVLFVNSVLTCIDLIQVVHHLL